MTKTNTATVFITLILFPVFLFSQPLSNSKIDGYRGIWFELNQKYEFGDKYSGGLGTYTVSHIPMAIYSKKAHKTFFVYGGTTSENERHLLCMAGEFDHKTGMVTQPTVVFDKQTVNDPHDNPSMMIDRHGFIWIFISGRAKLRPGFKFRSVKPFSIEKFSRVSEEEMTYPQPWNTKSGYIHLFTKYTGVRQLYFETSADGYNWTDDKLLAAIPQKQGEPSGHYQISNLFKNRVAGTFFNRHPNGDVDKRTDLYYLQTSDLGHTWTDVRGNKIKIPVEDKDSPTKVMDYQAQGKNVYLIDMGFENNGNPVCLYIRSNGHKPGPESAPCEWCITRWDGKQWITTAFTTSDHNYDVGSLFIGKKEWKIVAPTDDGPQKWGVGGEVVLCKSIDKGKNWTGVRNITHSSIYNNSYIRRPLNAKPPFCFFWANGNPHQFSKSELFFGDFEGNVWKLPYMMKNETEKPVKIN